MTSAPDLRPPSRPIKAAARFAKWQGRLAELAILCGIVLIFSVINPSNFPTVSNFNTILNNAAIPAILGVGASFVVLTGRIDLSIEGVMGAAGMTLALAQASSLVSVAAFGATTAANYALTGLVDWRIAGFFVAGGLLGGDFLGRRGFHRTGSCHRQDKLLSIGGVFSGHDGLVSDSCCEGRRNFNHSSLSGQDLRWRRGTCRAIDHEDDRGESV